MQPKAGLKTSEFLLSLLAIALGALPTLGVIPTESVALRVAGLGLVVLSALGYTVARSMVKLGLRELPGEPQAAPELTRVPPVRSDP